MSNFTITNVLVIVALGLVATAAMTLILYMARWVRLIDVDIIDTLGSVFTRQRAKYHSIGWGIHLAVGILFSFVYIAVWNILDAKSALTFLVFGGIIGATHGILVSFFVAIFVAEHHRLRRMRGANGLGIAVVQWGAHVVYGLTLGGAAALYFYYLRR